MVNTVPSRFTAAHLARVRGSLWLVTKFISAQKQAWSFGTMDKSTNRLGQQIPSCHFLWRFLMGRFGSAIVAGAFTSLREIDLIKSRSLLRPMPVRFR